MTRWRYRFAGLVIESDLAIPEWEGFDDRDTGREPDARISLETGTAPPAPGSAAAETDAFSLAIPNVARYDVGGGRQVRVWPAPGSDAGEIRLYLLGSAFAALAHQRGMLLLHSSVVRIGGRSVALCGPAGSGKSTLAAALVNRGGSFVCDDLGRFEVCDGRAAVYPSTPRLKLSVEALQALGWPADLARVHARAVKRVVPQLHVDPWSPVPLDALYLLDWAESGTEVNRMTGLRALRALVEAGTFRPGLLASMEHRAAHWRQCAAIAGGVDVYGLRRPRRWDALDEAVGILAGPA